MKFKACLIGMAAATGCLFFYNSSHGQQPPMQKHGPFFRTPMTMEALDGDKNNQITLEEFIEAHKKAITQRFEIMDKNGDKVITDDELQAAEQRIRQGGSGQGGPGHGGPGPGGFGPAKERPPFQSPFDDEGDEGDNEI